MTSRTPPVEGCGEPLADELPHRHAAEERHAEISCSARQSQSTYCTTNRPIEAEALGHLGDLFGCRVLADEHRDGPAGDRIDHEEDAGRRRDQTRARDEGADGG